MNALAGRALRVVQVGLFYLLLLWLALMLFAGNVAALPLLLTPRWFRQPIVQRAISAIFRVFLWGCVGSGLMRIDLAALDALNHERKLLLVANHPSMIDVFLVISRVRRAICLMKASISANIFLGVGAYLAGYVSNRHGELMLRDAATAVARGGVLLTFPEGTRTTRQPINAIKSGPALIAKRAQAPLQIVFITTNSPYLSKGWKIWRPPQFPVIYKARLGRQLRCAGPLAQTVEQLQTCFEQELPRSIDRELCL